MGLLPNSQESGRIALSDSVEATIMMGQKVFQEKFFYDFNSSKRIPDDHILRRLSDAVEIAFVRRLTAPFYSHTGQPPLRYPEPLPQRNFPRLGGKVKCGAVRWH